MKIINRFLDEARNFNKKNSVKALVVCPNGGILIMRRQNDQGGGGNWDLPGGAIEEGESQIDALKREVFEETGLKIDNVRKVKTANLKIPETGVDSDMHIYSAKAQGDIDVQLKPATWKGADGKPEHTEYKWIFRRSELENLKMIDQLKSIILSKLKDDTI
jgi:8-oxo-dGTP pyrophosphatase MutT (NUDIX family)